MLGVLKGKGWLCLTKLAYVGKGFLKELKNGVLTSHVCLLKIASLGRSIPSPRQLLASCLACTLSTVSKVSETPLCENTIPESSSSSSFPSAFHTSYCLRTVNKAVVVYTQLKTPCTHSQK